MQKDSTKCQKNTCQAHIKKAFKPKLLPFSNKLFFDVGSTLIIIQPESEKTILKADFEIKLVQRVRN